MKKAPTLPASASDPAANPAALFAYFNTKARHCLLDYLLNGFNVNAIPRTGKIGPEFSVCAYKCGTGENVVSVWPADPDAPRHGPLLEIKRDAAGSYRMRTEHQNPLYLNLAAALTS